MPPEIKITRLIRSRRRTVAIEISREAELIVRAPLRAPESVIFAFVKAKSAWILAKQKQIKARASLPTPEPISAEDEQTYRRRASIILKERCDYFAALMGLRYNALRIGGAKHRYGSCSGQNALSFTWRLMLAPQSVIDYVVIHELSHIVHKNHGLRFWKKVAAYCPNYKLERKWLRENHNQLV